MSENTPCPVCSSPLNKIESRPDDKYFLCPLCGNFIMTGSLLSSIPGIYKGAKDAVPKLNHPIRQMSEVGKIPELNTYNIKKYFKRDLPKPIEQADLLIRWLGKNIDGPGETIWLDPTIHRSIIGAKSDEGFDLIVSHLFDVNLLTGQYQNAMREVGRAFTSLSFEGWEYYDSLKRRGNIYHKTFMPP